MESQNAKTRKMMKRACQSEGVATVAHAVGMHPGTLSNQISGQSPYEPAGKTRNLIDAAIDFIAATKNLELLSYMASRFDQILVPNPAALAHDDPAIEQLNKFISSFSEELNEIAVALRDGKVTGDEASRIRHRWELLKCTGESFVLSAENGSFLRKGGQA